MDSVFRIGRASRRGDTVGALVLRELTVAQWTDVRVLGDFPWPFGAGGLRAGDRVMAIGDRATHSWRDFIEGYGALAASPHSVVVERNGRRVTVSLGRASAGQ